MKLYCLDYWWGRYDSARETEIGIYSSEENRDAAKERWSKKIEEKLGWPFSNFKYEKHGFAEWTCELDQDIEF